MRYGVTGAPRLWPTSAVLRFFWHWAWVCPLAAALLFAGPGLLINVAVTSLADRLNLSQVPAKLPGLCVGFCINFLFNLALVFLCGDRTHEEGPKEQLQAVLAGPDPLARALSAVVPAGTCPAGLICLTSGCAG